MKRIVVLGAGESGVGAAILAKAKNFDVFVSDKGQIKDKYKEELVNRNISFEEGKHTESLILNASEVIKSPGIPKTVPLIKKLVEQGTPIISEIEFAGRYTDAKKICITGSNGKTTTTMLTYYTLLEAGLDVGLAGNVGNSLAWQVAESPHEYYVIELSSFQLDNMYDFKADIAILLNITPDHLDRYEYKFENYIASKFRIIQNQGPEDAFIYWLDDPVIHEAIKNICIKSKQYPFTDHETEDAKAFVRDDVIFIQTEEGVFTMDKNKMSLKGKHNVYNSLASGLASKILSIKNEKLKRALSAFKGVEHRMEKVKRIHGVDYINDSKATNVNSCWYALQSINTKIVLILGGTDKGNDYSEIEDLVKEKVSALIFLGVDNAKLHQFFDGKVDVIRDAKSMKEAVDIAYEISKKGETVLLSPCCASFDLFKNYEDRGEQFKECVFRL